MIKKLLGQFTKVHVQPAPSIVFVDYQHYCLRNRSLINNLSLLLHSRHALKEALLIVQNTNPKHLYLLMLFGSIAQVMFHRETLYSLYLDFSEDKVKDAEPKKQVSLSDITVKEVLQKEHIGVMLASLIERLNLKESTQHNITKQLNKLFQIEFIYKKSFELTKQLVLDQVFRSEDIYLKLRTLTLQAIWNQKHQLTSLAASTIREQGQQPTTESLTNLYNQQAFQQGLANALMGALYSNLEDRNNVNALIQMLDE